MRQGCYMSPSLFNLYTDVIFREIEHHTGLSVSGRNITNLQYADDTVLLAESEEHLHRMLTAIKERSEIIYGLNTNVKKTKVMVITDKVEMSMININLNNEIFEQVPYISSSTFDRC